MLGLVEDFCQLLDAFVSKIVEGEIVALELRVWSESVLNLKHNFFRIVELVVSKVNFLHVFDNFKAFKDDDHEDIDLDKDEMEDLEDFFKAVEEEFSDDKKGKK